MAGRLVGVIQDTNFVNCSDDVDTAFSREMVTLMSSSDTSVNSIPDPGRIANHVILIADLPACTVPAAGRALTHHLSNPGAERLAFKDKSSNNNNEYRVKPVFGFVEAGATVPLEVVRKSGIPKMDKLIIEFAAVAADVASEAFKAATLAGTITIPLSATA